MEERDQTFEAEVDKFMADAEKNGVKMSRNDARAKVHRALMSRVNAGGPPRNPTPGYRPVKTLAALFRAADARVAKGLAPNRDAALTQIQREALRG